MQTTSSVSWLHCLWLLAVTLLALHYPSYCDAASLSTAFNVTASPTALPFDHVTYNPARWGQMLPQGNQSYELVVGTGTLCSPPAAGTDWSGKAVIVMRGSCAFSTKALAAAAANAAMFILYNCQPGVCTTSVLPDGMDEFVPQAAVGDAPAITSIYITYEFGNQLVSSVVNGSTVQISIAGTGAIDAGDLSALQSIYSAANALGDWKSGIPSGSSSSAALATAGLLQWSTLKNSSFDPCKQRIWGLWCVDGRVTTIDCEYCGAAGPLSSAIYQLSELRFVSFRDNQLQGAMPDNVLPSIGDLQHLHQLYLDGNDITSLPSGFGQLSGLYLFSGSSMALQTVPASLNQLTQLVSLDLNGNSIGWLPDISGFSSINTLDVSNNHIAAALPSFDKFASATSLNFGNNNFTGQLQTGSINNLVNLQTLYLNTNGLTGTLPSFINCSSLVTLDLSQNKLTGSIPSAWSKLQAIHTLNLASNQLVTPIDPLQQMSKLSTLDFSQNNLTCGTSTAVGNTDVGAFMVAVVPPSITYADFSYNRLNCSTWAPGWGGTMTHFQTLSLAHNNITSQLPTDLWTQLTLSGLLILLLSDNNISGDFPTGSPAASLQIIDLTDNPNFVNSGLSINNPSGSSYLPSYISVDRSMSQPLVNGSLANFTCPTLYGLQSGRKFTVNLDPSYYGYSLCRCTLGFYGSAPNCIAFPTLVYETTDSGVVTDGSSTGRQRVGMDVSWVIQPPPNLASTGQPIVGVNVSFSYFDLKDTDNDIIYVHTGNNLTTGKTLATYTQSQPPPLTGQTFLGNAVTLRFMSDSQAGPHFTANYSASATCPSGFTYDTTSQSCVFSSGGGSSDASKLPIYIGLIVVGVALLLIFLFFMYKFRSSAADKPGVKSTYDFVPLAKYAGLIYAYDALTKPLRYTYGEHSAAKQGQLRQLALLYVLIGGLAIYLYAAHPNAESSFDNGLVTVSFLCFAIGLVPLYLLVRLGLWLLPVCYITLAPCILSIIILANGGSIDSEPMMMLLTLFIISLLTCHFLVNHIATLVTAVATVCLLSLMYIRNGAALSWVVVGCYSFIAGISVMLSALAARAQQEDIRSRMLFTSTISHELRTPLSAVIGNLELLLGTELDDHQKDCGTVALYSGERMLELIDEFLDYAKIEVGKMEIVPAEFDIKVAMHNCVAEVAQKAVTKSIDLSLYVAPTVPTLATGDAKRVRQCLINLLSNSCKFTPEEGTIEVDVLAQAVGHGKTLIVCQVIDSGATLTPEEQAALFKQFSQVDKQKEGTGLGLVIVKQLATLMNGSAGFHTMPGGNMFWFSFQVENCREPSEEDEQEVGGPQQNHSVSGGNVPSVHNGSHTGHGHQNGSASASHSTPHVGDRSLVTAGDKPHDSRSTSKLVPDKLPVIGLRDRSFYPTSSRQTNTHRPKEFDHPAVEVYNTLTNGDAPLTHLKYEAGSADKLLYNGTAMTSLAASTATTDSSSSRTTHNNDGINDTQDALTRYATQPLPAPPSFHPTMSSSGPASYVAEPASADPSSTVMTASAYATPATPAMTLDQVIRKTLQTTRSSYSQSHSRVESASGITASLDDASRRQTLQQASNALRATAAANAAAAARPSDVVVDGSSSVPAHAIYEPHSAPSSPSECSRSRRSFRRRAGGQSYEDRFNTSPLPFRIRRIAANHHDNSQSRAEVLATATQQTQQQRRRKRLSLTSKAARLAGWKDSKECKSRQQLQQESEEQAALDAAQRNSLLNVGTTFTQLPPRAASHRLPTDSIWRQSLPMAASVAVTSAVTLVPRAHSSPIHGDRMLQYPPFETNLRPLVPTEQQASPQLNRSHSMSMPSSHNGEVHSVSQSRRRLSVEVKPHRYQYEPSQSGSAHLSSSANPPLNVTQRTDSPSALTDINVFQFEPIELNEAHRGFSSSNVLSPEPPSAGVDSVSKPYMVQPNSASVMSQSQPRRHSHSAQGRSFQSNFAPHGAPPAALQPRAASAARSSSSSSTSSITQPHVKPRLSNVSDSLLQSATSNTGLGVLEESPPMPVTTLAQPVSGSHESTPADSMKLQTFTVLESRSHSLNDTLELAPPAATQPVADVGRRMNSSPPGQATRSRVATPAIRPTQLTAIGRVLFIDDNTTIRKTVQRQFQSLRWDVDLAEDGQEGFELYQKNREYYNLLVTDCEMPRVDGYKLTEMIRADEKRHHAGKIPMPVLALTANAFKENIDTCMQSGMDAVLTKPLKLAVLKDTLQAWGDKRLKELKVKPLSPPQPSTSTLPASGSPTAVASKPPLAVTVSRSSAARRELPELIVSPVTTGRRRTLTGL